MLARTPELVLHLRGAINHGVTAEELEEVLLMAVVYGGFPVAVEATNTLREVLEAMKPAAT